MGFTDSIVPSPHRQRISARLREVTRRRKDDAIEATTILLQPCTDPVLAPEDGSDNEIAAERLRVAKAYLDCKVRHAALVDRVK